MLYSHESANTVPVTVVRDPGFLGGGCSVRVLVNDQLAAYVRAGEKVILHMPPGEYILGADTNTEGLCAAGVIGLVETEANLQLGRPRSYRIGFTPNGAISISRTVER